MTDKTTAALKLAEKTLRDIIRVYKFETGTPVTALAAICEALAEHEKQGPFAFDENNLPIPKTYPAMPMTEHFCFCGNEISLQMVSGGTAPEGLYGRVTLKVGDRYVDYYTAPVSAEDIRARSEK